jgi:hypothetical protein
MASTARKIAPETETGKALFVAFLESYLGIEFSGFQSGFGILPDQILFAGVALDSPGHPLHGKTTTLSVSTEVMLLPQEQALAIIEDKKRAAAKSFEKQI